MKVIYRRLPSKKIRCAATIGVFDGIHLGHQFILKKVIKEARKQNFSSLIITFDILPQQFLLKKQLFSIHELKKIPCGYIADFDQKTALVKSLSLDYCWFLKTSQFLLKLSPKDFIKYVCRAFAIKKLIVGQDFRFGYRAKGEVNLLKKLQGEFGFDLSVVQKKTKQKRPISSSYIRELIQRSEFKMVKKFLGRNFSINGRVEKGRGIGSKLGFPTANISLSGYVIPSPGVYVGYVVIKRKVYLAAVNIGLRLTASKDVEEKLIEAHIINFNKNVLGQKIKLVFLEKIRDEQKFSSYDKLSLAIAKDVRLITSKYSTRLPKYPQPIVL